MGRDQTNVTWSRGKFLAFLLLYLVQTNNLNLTGSW